MEIVESTTTKGFGFGRTGKEKSILESRHLRCRSKNVHDVTSFASPDLQLGDGLATLGLVESLLHAIDHETADIGDGGIGVQQDHLTSAPFLGIVSLAILVPIFGIDPKGVAPGFDHVPDHGVVLDVHLDRVGAEENVAQLIANGLDIEFSEPEFLVQGILDQLDIHFDLATDLSGHHHHISDIFVSHLWWLTRRTGRRRGTRTGRRTRWATSLFLLSMSFRFSARMFSHRKVVVVVLLVVIPGVVIVLILIGVVERNVPWLRIGLLSTATAAT